MRTIAIVMVAVAAAAHAEETSYRDTPSYRVLMSAREFEELGVDPAHAVVALWRLLEHPNAARAFQELVEKASPAGKLYALCGLYHSDHARFLRAIEDFRGRRLRATVVRGCCVSEGEDVGSIVESPSRRAVRLSQPGQTVAEWVRSRGWPEGARGVDDIYGGGIPAALMDARRSFDELEPLAIVMPRLKHPAAETRIAACESIEERGAWAEEAAADVGRLLADERTEVRSAAAECLWRIGPWAGLALSSIRRALLDPVPAHDADEDDTDEDDRAEVRATLCYTLATLGRAGARVLAEVIENDTTPLRFDAVWALASMETEAPAAAPVLARQLDSGAADIRPHVAEALWAMGSAALEARDSLVAALDAGDEKVRAHAAAALGNLDAGKGRAPAELLAALKDRSVLVRRRAAQSLWAITRQPELAMPTLVECLERGIADGDWELRLSSSLERTPTTFTSYHETLADMARTDPSSLDAVVVIIEKSRNTAALSQALGVLRRLGDGARAAAPPLRKLLEREVEAVDLAGRQGHPPVGLEAAKTLWLVAGDAGPYVDLFVERLSDKNEVTRRFAASSIFEVGRDAAGAVEALSKALDDTDRHVREHAARALGAIGTREVVPGLTRALDDPEPDVRATAVRALGELGAISTPAIGALRRLLEDPEKHLRISAQVAIREIERP